MRVLSRSRLVLLAGLSVCLLAGTGRASAQAKADFARVQLPTWDGMELGGTFYPNTKKDAVVLLLHDFTHKGGGGSHGNWDTLAARLQKEGYAVLSFDFRGFGNSKSVSPDFWKYPHNRQALVKAYRGGVKPAESIDQKDFPAQYYSFLVNDIAAARAFLDRKNDSRELNTSNLIVIGAGEGATLGALWMAAEMRRQKDKMSANLPVGFAPTLMQLDDPQGKDFAGAIWLTISPTLCGRAVGGGLKSALADVGREDRGKVPTVFVYGKSDSAASNLTLSYLNAIQNGKDKKVELKGTGEKTIAGTELTGSKLLGDRLETTSFIVKRLNQVMDDRGSREWKKREEEKYAYCWTLPWPTAGRVQKILAKMPGEAVQKPIPPHIMGLR